MKCPICKKEVESLEKNQTYPFCSSRCRLADLSRWISGDYAIPGERVQNETIEAPEEDKN